MAIAIAYASDADLAARIREADAALKADPTNGELRNIANALRACAADHVDGACGGGNEHST